MQHNATWRPYHVNESAMLTVQVTMPTAKKPNKSCRAYHETDRQLAPLNQVKIALDIDSGATVKPVCEPLNSYVLNRKCQKRICDLQRLRQSGGACVLPKLAKCDVILPDEATELSRNERLSDSLPPMRFHANDGPVFDKSHRYRMSRFANIRRDERAAPSRGVVLHTLKPTLDSILKSSGFVAQQSNELESGPYTK